MRSRRVVVLAALVLLTGCKKNPGGVAQENSKENLTKVFNTLQAAIASGDTKTAAAITKSFLPDEDRIKKALRDDASPLMVAKLKLMYERFGDRPKEMLARLLRARAGQTSIQVHGATTEAIAANARGTIVWKEFPGGAVRLAKTVLRPGVTFYEIETVKPGKQRGMKYHLFYWDGKQWSMLGPAWRASRTR